ncbi:penicillin-binding protein [Candidatus Saccharibacteria bacterium]|nr:penicillin-binding protein [Candidatus Saccharibacteria bacterium]
MADFRNGPSGGGRRRGQKTFTTKSGKTLKLNRNFSDRRKATNDERAAKKALYLSTLPKNRWKRLAYRLHPKRVAAYWFSREGALMALKITGIGIVVCFFLTIGVFAYFRKDLPKIKGIAGDKLGGSITYYDRSGKTVLWQDYDAVKRIPVEGDQISPYMKQATIAIEDKNFYKHGAFDVTGIARAGFNDVFGGGPIQGGSTITQQLVKLNEQWTDNRTITRKIKELILAVELEREYSKEDILTGYLNAAPYGGIENGVEVAARDYFNTSAKDLTLAQAAMLAAIPKSPSYYSPYSSSKWNAAVSSTDGFGEEALLGRQHYILDQMVDQGMITREQAKAAKDVDVLAQVQKLKSKYHGIRAPYFVLAAKQELEKKYGAQTIQRGGWKVTTTLNTKLQSLAEKEVKDGLYAVKVRGGDNIAFVAEDVQTGQIVAEVGGVDFNNDEFGKINYAQTPIPPGSSFKPYDYASLIEYKHAGAGSVIYDDQGPLPGYPCTDKNRPKYDDNANCLWDYDFKYPGALTLRYALGGSRNVPAVKANLMVGTDKVIETAEKLMNGGTDDRDGYGYHCFSNVKLTERTQCYGASAIGDGAYLHLDEHVNGIATLSRLGKWVPKTYILSIEDAAGKTLLKWKQPKGKQVIGADTAYIMNDMLSDPRASYMRGFRKFHRQANGWHFAIKTGTTNDNYDGLMASYSTKYAVVTWVGYHTRNIALTGFMEDMTGPIVRGWMETAHQNLEAKNWEEPASVQTAAAYVRSGGFGTGAIFPSPSRDLFPAAYKPRKATYTSATIDKVSGKLATSCTPSLARQKLTSSNATTFSVDEFVTGGSSGNIPKDKDNVHDCGDTKPSVQITLPIGDTCTGTCQFSVTPFAGTHPLDSKKFRGTVVVYINGKSVGTYSAKDSGTPIIVEYTSTGPGSVDIKATVTDSVLYQSSDSATMTTV